MYVFQISALVPIQKEMDTVPAERRYQRMSVQNVLLPFSEPSLMNRCQDCAVRTHGPFLAPSLLSPPSSEPDDSNLLHNNHRRLRRCVPLLALVPTRAPRGSLPPRDGQLSRDAREGGRRELSGLLPDRVGMDQGESTFFVL